MPASQPHSNFVRKVTQTWPLAVFVYAALGGNVRVAAESDLHGTVCSVAREGVWSVASEDRAQSEACRTAVAGLGQRLVAIGMVPEVTPAYDILIQSFYRTDAPNRVYLNCTTASGREFQRIFDGRGKQPVDEAVRFGENGANLKQCRVSVVENEGDRILPTRARTAVGFCGYATENGKWSLRIAQPGTGRDLACEAARQDLVGEKIFRRSAGYIWSARDTQFSFQCVGGSESRSVSGFDSLVTFRDEKRRAANAEYCVFVSDLMGDPTPGGGGVVPPRPTPPPGPGQIAPWVPPSWGDVERDIAEQNREFERDALALPPGAPLPDGPEVELDSSSPDGVLTIRTPVAPPVQERLRRQVENGAPERDSQRVLDGHTKRRSKDAWSVGSSDINLTVSYDTSSENVNRVVAEAKMVASVFGNEKTLLGLSGIGSIQRRNQNRVEVDVVLRSTVMGRTTELLKRNFWTLTRDYLPRTVLFDQAFFSVTKTVMIGPVPVTGEVQVAGQVGHDKTGFSWDGQDVQVEGYLLLNSRPFASVNAKGTAAVGVPTMRAGIGGSVALVSGEVEAQASSHYKTNLFGVAPDANSCVSVYLDKLSLLDGRLFAFYSYYEPTVQLIEVQVEGVCKVVGRIFGNRRICDGVKREIQQVRKIVTLYREKNLHKWSGIAVKEDHKWYDTCPRM